MSSVLLKAVLSTSPDYDLLFESLSWPEEEQPEEEQLEALTSFIEGVGALLADPDSALGPKRRCILGKIESVVWSKCLPLLSKISREAGGGAGCRESTSSVCRLLGVCLPLCGEEVYRRVAMEVLPSLQQFEEAHLSVEVSSEVIAALLPSLSSDEELRLSVLSSALSSIRKLPDLQASRILSRVLVPLLGCCSRERLDSLLKLVLEDLTSWHSSSSSSSSQTSVVTQRGLLCFTALSDHLLKYETHPPSSLSSSSCDPRLYPQFWRMIQDGLTHRDSLTRKRALYLLKRCAALSEDQSVDCPPSSSQEDEILFRWLPAKSKLLRDFWEDYVLVMETLEENQVHVVRPVLNRIDTLVQATVNDSQGPVLLHPSWLLCVYQRMFHSENKSLMKEGVCHLLQLQVLHQPAFALAFSQFIVGPFMDVLSESSLFQRSVGQNVGECPELGLKLQVFLTTFFSSLPLEERGSVLLQLIQQLGSKHWCAVPLLFLSRALSHLPPSPLLGVSGLSALREVLHCTMITHQVLLRGAAQAFLLKAALSLTAVSSVTLEDVFSFLIHFRADESLTRGTELWDQVCAWLSNNENSFKPRKMDGQSAESFTIRETVGNYVKEEMLTYLRVPASTGETEKLPDPKEADKLARAVLLCVDMERSGQGAEISKTLESLLSPLLDTLSRLSTNIYSPLRKSDKSLQLALRLLQLVAAPSCQRVSEKPGDDVTVSLEMLILKHASPIQDFIFRRLCGELQELFDVERAELYLSVLRQLVVTCRSSQQQSSKIQHSGFTKLINNSLTVLTEPSPQIPSVVSQVKKAVTMASLAMICYLMEQNLIDIRTEGVSDLKLLRDYFCTSVPSTSHGTISLVNFNIRLLKPQTTDSSGDQEAQSVLLQDWGRIAASFMRDQWACLNFLMKTFGSTQPEEPETLKAALGCSIEALALLPSDLVLPVLAFMETVLPQLVQDEEALCVEVVTQSWVLVQELSTNAHDFWPALRGFISMAFQHKLLQLTQSQAPTVQTTLKQIASELMELSQSKSGVFGELVQHCCQTWLPSATDCGQLADSVFLSVFNHVNIVAEACVYGPVFRRDQRLTQDVHMYVEQLGEKCAANVAVSSDNRDDQLPRTCIVAFLSRLDPSNVQHGRLIEQLVMDLLKRDNGISKSKVRYYSNSLQHRIKNRVWQTLLLLLPKLREESVATLLNHVYEAGYCANQASVKYLIEWMMILILFRHPQHIDSLWSCFNVDQEKTKTSICTFLSVLVHFSVILPNLKDKAVQLHKALDVILQSCFNHNFSVRLYALLALKRVWSLAENLAGEEADALRGLSSVVKACLSQAEAMQSTGNANKNWMRIQEHFFFGAFDPVRDYSFESIFHIFPSLSEVADDEWIPTWKFEKLPYFSANPLFPLMNPSPDLKQLQPGDWIQQDKSEQDKEERWTDVQKKITPWGLGIQEQELELQLVTAQRAARVGKLHGALVVVASLIDKPTNLGGLCRTCEIFGASALVLDSLRHLNDKHFQSLSVSSELWLPLLEVKPIELTDFLQVKKNEGYCIVGVEQTANSHSLQDYQFPQKTLLLLGNEREGIPATLLQMLDVCVEIPQLGVIRSLNVHVSAALLIWEYTRQHLSSGSKETTSTSS